MLLFCEKTSSLNSTTLQQTRYLVVHTSSVHKEQLLRNVLVRSAIHSRIVHKPYRAQKPPCQLISMAPRPLQAQAPALPYLCDESLSFTRLR